MSKLITPYDQIVNVANIATRNSKHPQEVIPLAAVEKLRPSVEDGKKVLLIVIDMQNDFMPNGSLGVPGSDGDVKRLTQFMYDNMNGITDVMCSIDTHYPMQIFFPCMWADEKGKQPDPFTMITYDDCVAGKYRLIHGVPKKALECLKALKDAGKVGVFLWPYHCLAGTPGFSLESEFTNMLNFYAAAKGTKPELVFKGTDRYSEMYGIIKPEYNPGNFVNDRVLAAIEDYQEIYLAGEASSHCLLESGKQILEYYKARPEVTQRITILEDCTSPVTGFEQQATDAFEAFKRDFGIKVAKSTDISLV